jgi:hypothetical protein
MSSPDIRAGISLLIAALLQKDKYHTNIEQIDRGYERIDERLRAIVLKSLERKPTQFIIYRLNKPSSNTKKQVVYLNDSFKRNKCQREQTAIRATYFSIVGNTNGHYKRICRFFCTIRFEAHEKRTKTPTTFLSRYALTINQI